MNKIIDNMSEQEYRKAPGLSNSFLIFFSENYLWAARKKKRKSKSMDIGSRLHRYLLEPEIFEQEYVMAPPECKNRLEKPYPEFKKTTNKEIILYKEFKELEEIYDKVMNYKILENKILGDIILNSRKEAALFWEEYEVQRKAKIDILYELENSVILADLKKR